jgi:cell division protein FtsL
LIYFYYFVIKSTATLKYIIQMIEIVCTTFTIVMAVMLGFIKMSIDNMKNDIALLCAKVDKNKKEIIGIRNDLTDYFQFENYNYDDD